MAKREEFITNLLLKKNLVSQAQIDRAKDEMKKTGLGLERALEKMGFITEHDLVNILAESMGVLYVNLEDYLIDPEVTKLIPEELARKHKVIPLFKIGDTLTVAMSTPKDIIAKDDLRMRGKFGAIEPVFSTEKQIMKSIEQYYGVSGSVEDIMNAINVAKLPPNAAEDLDAKLLAKEADQAPIVKLVNMIITQAVKEKASDIHVEPEEDKVRVRYRIDGILHEISTPPKNLQSIIISRIKILSKMD